MSRFARSILAALMCVALFPYAKAAPLAYVPNEGSASISVIDTATDTVVSTLRFGQRPRGIAVSLDGKRLYISDQTANALVVVDLARNVEAARVPLGDSPEAIPRPRCCPNSNAMAGGMTRHGATSCAPPCCGFAPAI